MTNIELNNAFYREFENKLIMTSRKCVMVSPEMLNVVIMNLKGIPATNNINLRAILGIVILTCTLIHLSNVTGDFSSGNLKTNFIMK